MIISQVSYRTNGPLVSSPEPKAHKVSLQDGHALASISRPQFQRSSPLKSLGQSKPNFMWSILGKGEQKYKKWSRSHDQDGRHAHIYGKNHKKIFFSGTGGPILTKLGM